MILPFFYLLLPLASAAATPEPRPLRFETNKGQTDHQVSFIARSGPLQIFFTPAGITFSNPTGPATTVRFPGAARARWTPASPQIDNISYLLGNDPSKWIQEAPVYDRIQCRDLYPGTDLIVYSNQGRLEYDIVLHPQADPAKIRLAFSSNSKLRQTADGAVEVEGLLTQHAPQIFQQLTPTNRTHVEGRFHLAKNNTLTLQLGAYDHAKPVTIDPVIEAATYIGGENDDEVVATYFYLTVGNTRSLVFPGSAVGAHPGRHIFFRSTSGARPPAQQNYSPWVGTLVIGGSGDDELTSLAVAPNFTPVYYLGGTTTSKDLPGAQTTYHGGASDGFLMSFTWNGSTSAAFSNRPNGPITRYIGGSGEDRITSLAAIPAFFQISASVAFAGVTDSPDLATPNAPQPNLAGGKDGFYGFLAQGIPISYLGGSGDDAAYAVAIQSPSTLWIGGETRSTDFPFPQPGINGASDAFLTSVTLDSSKFPSGGWGSVSNYRLGGSGEDSIRSIVISPVGATYSFTADSGSLVPGLGFAGITTSPDLPVVNAAQPMPGGGRDGFAGRWDITAQTPQWLTYLGGSADDEALSIAQNATGDYYVAGWTASTDLAVLNALQTTNAGGEDAMLAIYAVDGTPQMTAYYGGSGNDRARHVTITSSNAARLGGFTTSPDLPLVNAVQKPAGGVDGFTAEIGLTTFSGPSLLHMAKDSAFTLVLPPIFGNRDVPTTFKTSDPSLVRLVFNSLPVDPNTVFASAVVTLEALADSGTARITASSPGYPDKIIQVNLYPGVFVATYPRFLDLWNFQGSYLNYSYRALDSNSGNLFAEGLQLRPGAAPAIAIWTSDNPQVAVISDQFYNTTVAPISRGNTTVSLSINGYQVFNPSQTIAVVGPQFTSPASTFRIGRDLQRQVPLQFAPPGANYLFTPTEYRGNITIRSGDPSKLLLAIKGDTIASASIQTKLNPAPVVMAQALAGEGDVPIYITSSEFDGEVVVTATLEPSVLNVGFSGPGYSYISSPITPSIVYDGPINQSLFFALQPLNGPLDQLSPRIGIPPVVVKLESWNPALVEASRITLNLSNSETLTLIPRAPGSSDVTFSCQCGNIRIVNSALHIEFRSPQPARLILTQSLILGRNLQVPVNFNVSTIIANMTATSSDPSVVLVSPSSTTRGTAQGLVNPVSSSTSSYAFYLQSTGKLGSATVTVATPSGDSYTIAVQVTPSAAGFDPAALAPTVALFAIDPNTGAPATAQIPAPGLSIPYKISSEGTPATITPLNGTLTATTSTVRLTVAQQTGGPGVTIRADSDPDFTPPSALAALWLPPLSTTNLPGSITLSKDTVNLYPLSNPKPITASSSDPSRALLSLTPDATPTPSIAVPSSASSIYIHTLAATGSFSIHLEYASQSAQDITVYLRPLLLQLQSFAQTLLPGNPTPLSYNSPPLPPLRAGAAPVTFNVTVSDPTAAKVTPTTFTYDGKGVSFPSITRLTSAPAVITVSGPSDVAITPNPQVLPALSAPATAAIEAYQNLESQASINVSDLADVTAGAIVTVTSSDPSLLLTRNSGSPGATSISIPIPAGQTSTPTFYLQASAPGAVQLTVRNNGVFRLAANVTIVPTFAGCFVSPNIYINSPPPSALAIGSGSTANATCLITSAAKGAQLQNAKLNPGIGPITLNLSSANPAIATVTPTTLTFTASNLPDNNVTIAVKGLIQGQTTLNITQPGGFSAPPSIAAAFPVNVVAPTAPAPDRRIDVNNSWIGPYMQQRFSFSSVGGTSPVTATTEQTKLIQISNPQANQFDVVALATAGTAEVVFTFPDTSTLRVPLVLRTASLSSYGTTITPNSPGDVVVYLNTNVSNGLTQSTTPLPVTASVAPAGILSLDKTDISITNGQGLVPFHSLAAGTAYIKISTPPGVTPLDAIPVVVK